MNKSEFRAYVENIVKDFCLKNSINYRGRITILDLSFSVAVDVKPGISELLAKELDKNSIKYGAIHSLTGGDFLQTWINYADNEIFD